MEKLRTKTQLLVKMNALGACSEATRYVLNHTSDSAQEIGLKCSRADWLVWFLVRCEMGCQSFAFWCADRAVRVHAANAMDSAGLPEQGMHLRNLERIQDSESAYAAACAASRAAYAAYAAASYAADAADAADASRAAECDAQVKKLRKLWRKIT